jgi:hypothetical protein
MYSSSSISLQEHQQAAALLSRQLLGRTKKETTRQKQACQTA